MKKTFYQHKIDTARVSGFAHNIKDLEYTFERSRITQKFKNDSPSIIIEPCIDIECESVSTLLNILYTIDGDHLLTRIDFASDSGTSLQEQHTFFYLIALLFATKRKVDISGDKFTYTSSDAGKVLQIGVKAPKVHLTIYDSVKKERVDQNGLLMKTRFEQRLMLNRWRNLHTLEDVERLLAGIDFLVEEIESMISGLDRLIIKAEQGLIERAKKFMNEAVEEDQSNIVNIVLIIAGHRLFSKRIVREIVAYDDELKGKSRNPKGIRNSADYYCRRNKVNILKEKDILSAFNELRDGYNILKSYALAWRRNARKNREREL